ncbi:TraV family lipoprotein [Alteromonas gilva]|uniref:TraV family lipoprotein n=1 Tax=Alteromonas gilva TaxID=2987522 RepID=A0ABT5L7W4_9ALTE|nr:TraV family lipoprotein [Alteromonas gilva]MDC8832978.1 TraV family lipoprotein [Alteromonas gilva]
MKSQSITIRSTAAILLAGSLAMSGCTTIGKENFTCENMKKGGVCAGARDVYELTNNRESLENLTQEDLAHQKGYAIDGHEGHVHAQYEASEDRYIAGAELPSQQSGEIVVYEERTNEQHSRDSYQAAKVIPQTRYETSPENPFSAWPNNGEPLAPEALAVMSEPKPMRILVSSYTDPAGFLTLPGYVYVEVEPKTWRIGNSANFRPTRVVPLQMRKQSQQEMIQQEQRRKGVSPLNIITQPPTTGK